MTILMHLQSCSINTLIKWSNSLIAQSYIHTTIHKVHDHIKDQLQSDKIINEFMRLVEQVHYNIYMIMMNQSSFTN